MMNAERMLNAVLSDERLCKEYDIDPSEYTDLDDALSSDNPVVVAVAKIIGDLKGSNEQSTFSRLYKELFNYLNDNLL
jgi:hypothetical protein